MFTGNIFANGRLSVKFAKIFPEKISRYTVYYRGLVHMQTFIPHILVYTVLATTFIRLDSHQQLSHMVHHKHMHS